MILCFLDLWYLFLRKDPNVKNNLDLQMLKIAKENDIKSGVYNYRALGFPRGEKSLFNLFVMDIKTFKKIA